MLEAPLNTAHAGPDAPRRSAVDLLMRPSKRPKLPMLGGSKKGKGKEEPEPGRRKIQRKVDKKGEREKKAKAARHARRGWTALDDSDDDIADFVIDDGADLGYEEEEIISDWDDAGPSSSQVTDKATAIEQVPSASGSDLAVAGPSTPRKSIASRPRTPPSSSPVIGPGRALPAKQPSSTSSTPRSNRTATAAPQSPTRPAKSRHSFGDHLTNCILLAGPTGVGKTASVYACASELGFEVFELFPGVGKRTGKEIESAVGALAANHMVAGGGSGGGAGSRNKKKAPAKAGSIVAAFRKLSEVGPSAENGDATDSPGDGLAGASTGASVIPPQGNSDSPIDVDTQTDTVSKGPAMLSPSRLRHPNSVRQSLILIEEADILFEDDKGFWPALIQLIGRSRRPVIITCNDVSAVPVEDLPLQTTLTFVPPTSEEVVPYLQHVAQQEDHQLSSTDALRLYEGTSSALDGDTLSLAGLVHGGSTRLQARAAVWGAEKTRTDGPIPVLDLRLTLNELQFWSKPEQASVHETKVPNGDADTAGLLQSVEACDLKEICRYSDALSFAEANLRSPFSTVTEVHEPNAYHPLSSSAARDQIQHEHARMLLKPAWRDEQQIMAECGYVQTELFRSACISLVSSLWPSAPESDCTREVQGRIEHSELLAALGKDSGSRPLISNLSLSRPPAPALVLDYAPYLRAMVRADDVEAARHTADVQAAKAAACAAMDTSGSGAVGNPFMQLRLTRHTRNSQQSLLTAYGIFGGEEYARYIYADDARLEAVRKGGFADLALAVDAPSGTKLRLEEPAVAIRAAEQGQRQQYQAALADVAAQGVSGHI
ncbi:unnamed protein product [Tilletia controversa]|nr:unnamed protein product [Tilletia controversa]CAD6958275.1 unnamed protein product [Tilletia caries]CAD6970721.1 unnamed protein product [Tilletia controversa]CAD7066929.1 unnamed protein product [Tilletia caries]